MKKDALARMPTRAIPVKPLKYKSNQPKVNLKWWDVFDALRGTQVEQPKNPKTHIQGMTINSLQRIGNTSENSKHPNAHRLRMATQISQHRMERSHTLSSNHLPKTSFEIERPQTQGNSRLIINITTSLIRNPHRTSAISQERERRKLPILPNLTRNRVSRTPEIKLLTGNIDMPRRTYRQQSTETLLPAAPVNLSAEQTSWIANWIQTTNKAFDADEETDREQLPIICEN